MVWYNYRRVPAVTLAKQIIDEAGGRIRLLNRPRGGTRVVIELPQGR